MTDLVQRLKTSHKSFGMVICGEAATRIEQLESEVLEQCRLNDCRNNYSPTEFFDDVMACAAGALIHQQEMLRAQHEAIRQLREALTVLVENGGIGPEQMFDDARAALATTENIT